MTPERVYALLVEANPVPEPDVYLEAMTADRDRLRLVDLRRESMRTQEEIRELTPESPVRRPWIAAVAAALALVLAIGLVAWLAAGSDEAQVVDDPPPTTIAGETSAAVEALAATDAFFAALQSGDIDAVERLTTHDGEMSSADRRMWGFNSALIAAGFGPEIGTCTATATPDGRSVAVACPSRTGFPPFIALGINELVWPFDYLPTSGTLLWQPFEGADFSPGNEATAGYLATYDPAGYAEACDPAAYGFRDVVFDAGLAFTPECAAVVIPVMDDIVAWIEAGQPEPEAEALAAADAFFAAAFAGDIDGVARAVTPGGELAQSERRMWEFNIAAFEAGYQGEVGECTAEFDTAGGRVAVRCPWTLGDPVMVAMGVNELVAPFDYFPDTGRFVWRPFEGGDFSAANRATADYLKAFHPDEYAAACDPVAYNFQGIVFDNGMALTPECATLAVPLLEEIAAWIEAG